MAIYESLQGGNLALVSQSARSPLAARTDDGYDEHMSDAPEPILSPNETASSLGIGMVFRR